MKLTKIQLKKLIKEEIESQQASSDQYKKAIDLSINSLKELQYEMQSGSGDEGMSSYYVGTELEKVVHRLFKAAAWYKANGQKS